MTEVGGDPRGVSVPDGVEDQQGRLSGDITPHQVCVDRLVETRLRVGPHCQHEACGRLQLHRQQHLIGALQTHSEVHSERYTMRDTQSDTQAAVPHRSTADTQ